MNAIDALTNVAEHTAVIVTLGKGKTLRDVAGIVIAVRVEEDGAKVYKVAYGSGFDADTAIVKAGKIKLPVPVQTEIPADQEASA